MNIVAGTITFEGDIKIVDFSFNYVIGESKPGVWTIFVYGNTEIETSDDFMDFVGSFIDGEILSADLSISTEDKIKLFKTEPLFGDYVLKTVQGRDIFFEKALNGNIDGNLVAIRQGETSEIFGNRVIKMDFII